jgi:hypothetical protein
MATASSKRLVRSRMVAGRCMGLLEIRQEGDLWITIGIGVRGRRW